MGKNKALQLKIAEDIVYFADNFQKVNGVPHALEEVATDLKEYMERNYENINNNFRTVLSFTLDEIIREMRMLNWKMEYPGCQYVHVPSVYKMNELAEAYFDFVKYTHEHKERLQKSV